MLLCYNSVGVFLLLGVTVVLLCYNSVVFPVLCYYLLYKFWFPLLSDNTLAFTLLFSYCYCCNDSHQGANRIFNKICLSMAVTSYSSLVNLFVTTLIIIPLDKSSECYCIDISVQSPDY